MCPKLIAAIPSRVHDPKRPGDLLKVGGDPLDDAMDTARYGLYSWVTASEKPRELKMREAVRGLDLTSASIRWQQMLAEEQFKNSPRRVSKREMWRRRGMFR